MKIFVVSLKSAVRRRTSMINQLASLGLEFEFQDAICGKDLSPEDVKRLVDQKLAYRYEGYRLTPGEIGCALSHRAIYKKIVDEKLPYAMIFEDDVVIRPELAKIVAAIDTDGTLVKHGITLLSECPISSSPRCILSVEGMRLHDATGGWFAHAYIITNEAARKFIALQTPVKHVADCWRWLLKHRLVSIGAIRPALVEQQRDSFGSETTLGHADVGKLTWPRLMRHKIARCWWSLMDTLNLVEAF